MVLSAPAADLNDARCSCGHRFAVVSDGGWMYIRVPVAGRRHEERQRQRAYFFAPWSTVRVHCPRCHAWKELSFDEQRNRWTVQAWSGPAYAIGCSCEPSEAGYVVPASG